MHQIKNGEVFLTNKINGIKTYQSNSGQQKLIEAYL